MAEFVAGTDMLGQHHEKICLLGEGSYGKVFKCLNVQTQKMEAIKVIRRSHESVAHREIQILEKLKVLDPYKYNLVRFNGCFCYNADICLNFELLDVDLDYYIYYKKNLTGLLGLPLPEVRVIADQMTAAIYFLKSIGIVHGDIKPQNIMVVDRHQEPITVKLGDFGGAQLTSQVNPQTLVHTCFYSPPELLLGYKCDESVDVWSLGVTLLEMALGCDFLSPNESYAVLRDTLKLFGQPPDHVLDGGDETPRFFNRDMNNSQQWVLKTDEQYSLESGSTPSPDPDLFLCFSDIKTGLLLNSDDNVDLDNFLDLIQKMLHVDPEKRITPLEVRLHRFIVVPETEPEQVHELDGLSRCSSSEDEGEISEGDILENSSDEDTQLENSGVIRFMSHEVQLETSAEDTPLEKSKEAESENHEVQLDPSAGICSFSDVVKENQEKNYLNTQQENSGEAKSEKHEIKLERPADVCLSAPGHGDTKKNVEVALLENCVEVKSEKNEVQLEPSADPAAMLEDDSQDTSCFTSICKHVKKNAKWYGGALVFAAAACSVVMLVRSSKS